jgi:hypothetical protein
VCSLGLECANLYWYRICTVDEFQMLRTPWCLVRRLVFCDKQSLRARINDVLNQVTMRGRQDLKGGWSFWYSVVFILNSMLLVRRDSLDWRE